MAKRRPSGDGMVRKRDDGRWEGRIVVGHKESGDPIFRYVYADTQKELTAKLRQKIEAYRGVDLTEQSGMTLSEWLDQWLESVGGTIRPTTFARYRYTAEKILKPSLGDKRLSQLMPRDIQRFYDKLATEGRQDGRGGLSSGTIHGIQRRRRPTSLLKTPQRKQTRQKHLPHQKTYSMRSNWSSSWRKSKRMKSGTTSFIQN